MSRESMAPPGGPLGGGIEANAVEDDGYDVAARRAIRALLPVMIVIYFFSFLDRSNLALAKTAFASGLGIGPAAYGLGSGLFFLTYAFLELPSNLLAYRVGPRRWIARIAVTWGVLSAATLFVRGPQSFFALRLLLGAAEAGLFPALLLLTTSWFSHRERAIVVGWLYVAPPIALIIGNPVGGFIMARLDGVGGLHGWQWMFLLEGLPSVLMGVVVWFRLPDRPRAAGFLRPDQQATLERRAIASTEQRHAIERAGWVRSLLTPMPVLIGSIYFLNQVGWLGLVFFTPGAIHAMHVRSPFLVGLLSSSIGIGALVGVLVLPRLHRRSGHDAWSLALMTIGFLLCGLGFSTVSGHALRIVLVMAASAFGVGVLPVYWAIAMRHLHGIQAAASLAVINTMGLIGGFVGPYLFGLAESWSGRTSSGFIVIAIASTLALLPIALLGRAEREGRDVVAPPDAAPGWRMSVE